MAAVAGGNAVIDDAMKEMFEKYGEIKSAVVMKDGDGKSRGFGFVNFADHDEATKAIEDAEKPTSARIHLDAWMRDLQREDAARSWPWADRCGERGGRPDLAAGYRAAAASPLSSFAGFGPP